jgi:hypothetical protein
MKKKLINALCYLPEGQAIQLDDDTFLTGFLDGSDKIYGFGKLDGEIRVLNGSGDYSIDDIDKKDLEYVFYLSNIFEKIKTYQYKIYDMD